MSSVPLALALSNVGQEISSLRDTTLDLEAAIAASLIANAKPLSTETVKALQSFDRMAQTLDALSHFIRELRSELSGDQIIDLTKALDFVLLEDVACRLRSVDIKDHPTPAQTTELF